MPNPSRPGPGPRGFQRSLIAAVLIVASACATAASAQVYLPLRLGTTWSYATADGVHETRTVTGVTTILGKQYSVITYSNNPANEGLENYWSTNAEGDVFLAGFLRAADNFGYIYDPPILYLDAPLALGNSWLTNVSYYLLPGMVPQGQFEVVFGVLETPVLDLPAGTFPTYGVGQLAAVGGAAPVTLRNNSTTRYALDGSVLTGFPAADEWYAPGVGLVQFDVGEVFQLTTYGLPTPAGALSWGSVKSKYRQ